MPLQSKQRSRKKTLSRAGAKRASADRGKPALKKTAAKKVRSTARDKAAAKSGLSRGKNPTTSGNVETPAADYPNAVYEDERRS